MIILLAWFYCLVTIISFSLSQRVSLIHYICQQNTSFWIWNDDYLCHDVLVHKVKVLDGFNPTWETAGYLKQKSSLIIRNSIKIDFKNQSKSVEILPNFNQISIKLDQNHKHNQSIMEQDHKMKLFNDQLRVPSISTFSATTILIS